ncbi:hypothetical protein B0H67DRAFT_553941 [Lasiosphaeris hirsuta]|uniref:Uncharacterized protein n=1 Tax=Lasiosphaeris hirsuta TaxID=260670 RepID=A0AA40AGH1_9PEZI|nr:hypothetical protein B0H67DRAFT_553941 [Lasiosphaeris hirsuta]
MRISIISLAAICFLAAVEANVSDLTIPAVIKVGEEFVANFTYPIQQPRDQSIIWGIGPDTAAVGEVGGYGHVGVTKLDWSGTGKYFSSSSLFTLRQILTTSPDVTGGNYFKQIVHGLKISSDGGSGPRVIQAVIVGYIGAAGNMLIQTRYFRVNTTINGTTSADHVSDVPENRRSTLYYSA